MTKSPYQEHGLEEHLLRSEMIAQTFKIRVLQPMSRADGSERFPVVYVTDGDHLFGGLADLATLLQIMGDTSRFILVGIFYANSAASRLLRWRDFIPHTVRGRFREMLGELGHSSLSKGVDVEAITGTTDASHFLRFIREELMPFINARYPTLPHDSNYSGYSLGGTFGLYTLFTQPETFGRYILGSPGTSYRGENFGIELARGFITAGGKLNAKVFMSVGELEDFDRAQGEFELTSGYYRLARFLKESSILGLDLTLRVFAGESHATAWTLAFGHGMRTLFPSVDGVPEWLKFLNRT